MCFRPAETTAKLVKCPSCQMRNPETNEKCMKCGKPLPKKENK